jgi:curved DNA-binding protein CbpA
MSVAEARATLGVGDSATPSEIRAAYARLIRRTHPDHGGTTGLAAQLNAARDRLLKGSG